MSIVSLSSDLGNNNYSLAQFKAELGSSFPDLKSVDLFHHNEVFDIESIAYQVMGAIATFPDSSIHLIYSKYNSNKKNVLVTRIGNQFVIAPNNGIISLLHILDFNAKVYSRDVDVESLNSIEQQSAYFDCLKMLLNNSYANNLNETISFIQTKPFNTDLSFLDDKIICRVLHVNSLGNVILNIRKDEFDDYLKNTAFHILFVNIKVFQLSPNYSTAYNNNRIGALFNEAGFLELFMIAGNLAKLFNINKWQNNKIEIIKDNDTNREINFQGGA